MGCSHRLPARTHAGHDTTNGTRAPPSNSAVPASFEPRSGGRWYEKGVDGSECDWGRVLTWEPPHRLVLSWHLNGQWEVDADETHASEIEVRFTPDGDARTIIDFEHRHIERSAFAAQLRDGVDSPQGWTGLLALFAAKVKG